MLKPAPRPAEASAGSAGPTPPDGAEPAAPRPRMPTVRYLGFSVTPEGREYALQALHVLGPRNFVVLISHDAFATGEARFQDAPDLCSRRIARELLADPDLMPSGRLRLTEDELLDYRTARERGAPGRKRRGSGG